MGLIAWTERPRLHGTASEPSWFVWIDCGYGCRGRLVRLVANALARDAEVEVAALRRAGWLITGVAGGVSLLVLTLFSAPISVYMLGSMDHAGSVTLMGWPCCLLWRLASKAVCSMLITALRSG